MKLADQRRQVARDRGGPPPYHARLAGAHGPVGGRRVARLQPKWTVVTPTVEDISTGGQRTCCTAGRLASWPQGYAPTKHTVKLTTTVEPAAITAFRLELLTDPNLPLGGPGRSFKGTCALTEFAVEAGAAAKHGRSRRGSSSPRRPPTSSSPRRRSSRTSTTSRTRSASTGPVGFAIDGKDETAWGIDAGPGRRNVAAQGRLRRSRRRSSAPAARELTFLLKQNHGGWNSDDLMNNNLGRFRLSVTRRAATPTADPLPAAVREILAIPRATAHRRRRSHAVFSYWRTTVPEWKEANDEIEALWKQHPEPARRTLVLAGARRAARRRASSSAATSSSRARPSGPACPPFLHPLPADAAADAPDAGALARRPGSRRPRPARSSTASGRPTSAPAWSPPARISARRARRRRHPELLDWLAVEFMDHGWSIKDLHRLIVDVGHLPAGSRRSTPDRPREGSRTTACSPAGARFRVEGEIVRDIALAASGLLNPTVGGRSVMPPAPEFLFQPPASYAAVPVDRRDRPGPLPPRALHLSPALDAVPDAADLRRARGHDRLRPPGALEHAAPGPDALNETVVDGSRARLRADDPRRGRHDGRRAAHLRLPPLRQPPADRRRAADPRPADGEAAGARRRGLDQHPASSPPARTSLPTLPAGVDAGDSWPPTPSSPACC